MLSVSILHWEVAQGVTMQILMKGLMEEGLKSGKNQLLYIEGRVRVKESTLSLQMRKIAQVKNVAMVSPDTPKDRCNLDVLT